MSVLAIVFGMMIVTYIPRLLPFVALNGKELPKKFNRFLEFIPYAALGALIMPGALYAIEGNVLASLVGLAFAGIYSYLKGGIIVSVVGSMVAAYMILVI